MVALLTEGAQRRVEDALLGPLSPGADLRVVGEGSAANDGDSALGGPVSLVVGHPGSSGHGRLGVTLPLVRTSAR